MGHCTNTSSGGILILRSELLICLLRFDLSYPAHRSAPSWCLALRPLWPAPGSKQRTDLPERQGSVKACLQKFKSQTQGGEKVVTNKPSSHHHAGRTYARMLRYQWMGAERKDAHASSNHSFLNSRVMWSHRLAVVARHAGVDARDGFSASSTGPSIGSESCNVMRGPCFRFRTHEHRAVFNICILKDVVLGHDRRMGTPILGATPFTSLDSCFRGGAWNVTKPRFGSRIGPEHVGAKFSVHTSSWKFRALIETRW